MLSALHCGESRFSGGREQVGAAVADLVPGDPVVISFPWCGWRAWFPPAPQPLGSGRRNGRRHRWRMTLARNRKFADSPLEEAVSSEPVSVSPFPANREKYRELSRIAARRTRRRLEKASVFKTLLSEFPGQANRENAAPYQGIK